MPAIFADYADLCFALYGDRVKIWYTFNEARTFAVLGYTGEHAPSLCNHAKRGCRPERGVSPYIAAHHVLLAHARAVAVYRARHQRRQRGLIGITNNIESALSARASAAPRCALTASPRLRPQPRPGSQLERAAHRLAERHRRGRARQRLATRVV